jgi:hypothetical protein
LLKPAPKPPDLAGQGGCCWPKVCWQTAVPLPLLLCQQRQLFLPNPSHFPKTSTSLRCSPSTTFVEQDGRSPLKPLAISKNLNDQPAPQLPKSAPKLDRGTANWRWHNAAQGEPHLPRTRRNFLLPRTLASRPVSLFQVRLVDPILFSTFKPLTLTRVNLACPKPLLHENTGKATWCFPANFSAVPQNFARLV